MLVGITGRAQHGKDTVGGVFERNGYKKYSFAGPLKEMALVLDPYVWSGQRLSDVVRDIGWEQAKKHGEVRRFLQVLGTEAVRGFIGDDAWVDVLDGRLVADGFIRLDGDFDNEWGIFKGKAVVTDVRFPNEAQYIHDQGGVLIKVERPGFDNGLGTDHPSEAFIDDLDWDMLIVAETLDKLIADAEEVVFDIDRAYDSF